MLGFDDQDWSAPSGQPWLQGQTLKQHWFSGFSLFFALHVCLSFAPVDFPVFIFSFSSSYAVHVKECLLCFRCLVLGRLSHYLSVTSPDIELQGRKVHTLTNHVISSAHSRTKAFYGSICSRRLANQIMDSLLLLDIECMTFLGNLEL